MRTTSSINFWTEGHVHLSLYDSNGAIALEVRDEAATLVCPAFFIEPKHHKRIKAAIEAFNKAWTEANGTEN